jgi:hypothetical protein
MEKEENKFISKKYGKFEIASNLGITYPTLRKYVLEMFKNKMFKTMTIKMYDKRRLFSHEFYTKVRDYVNAS